MYHQPLSPWGAKQAWGSYFIGLDFKTFVFLEIDLGKQWDQFERLKAGEEEEEVSKCG